MLIQYLFYTKDNCYKGVQKGLGCFETLKEAISKLQENTTNANSITFTLSGYQLRLGIVPYFSSVSIDKKEQCWIFRDGEIVTLTNLG